MSHPSDQNLLRFGCPACGKRLVLNNSIAGKSGSCPACGAMITAPPVAVSVFLQKKPGRPVAIKPRSPASAKSQQSQSSKAQPLPHVDRVIEAPASQSRPVTIKPKRSVSPSNLVSQKYKDKQDAKVFLKILIAVIVVAAIAVVTFYLLKQVK